MSGPNHGAIRLSGARVACDCADLASWFDGSTCHDAMRLHSSSTIGETGRGRFVVGSWVMLS